MRYKYIPLFITAFMGVYPMITDAMTNSEAKGGVSPNPRKFCLPS